MKRRFLSRGPRGARKWFENPCTLCSAVAYCCGAVAPRAIAALLGRFLPRLGPPVLSPGGPFFCRLIPGAPSFRVALLRRGLEGTEIGEGNIGQRVGQRGKILHHLRE